MNFVTKWDLLLFDSLFRGEFGIKFSGFWIPIFEFFGKFIFDFFILIHFFFILIFFFSVFFFLFSHFRFFSIFYNFPPLHSPLHCGPRHSYYRSTSSLLPSSSSSPLSPSSPLPTLHIVRNRVNPSPNACSTLEFLSPRILRIHPGCSSLAERAAKLELKKPHLEIRSLTPS